ncbi:eukaryotic translation initiation factor 2D-like isoform X1 [Bolinopsis microptera]|uniref:eukaryotic translation initiation factor 2D-like isoform X1 n=1 Tax=Bolinopsis microptera TaxID=2820187 RepID=UPI0030796D20
MFCKPFKVKSSVQLKTSEKKKFRHIVEETFSKNPEIITVLQNKANVLATKLLPHYDSLGFIQVHSIDKVPLFMTLEEDNVPIPTVHTLWRIPDLLPRVIMPYNVLDKLLGGAHLMLPGIYTSSLPEYWDVGDIVAICGPSNGAALAVGTWALSRQEAIQRGFKGKGIHIYQIYQDQLWHYGTKEKLPSLPLPSSQTEVEGDEPGEHSEGVETDKTEEVATDQEDLSSAVESIATSLEEVAISKDDIIMEACYRALKTSLKKTDLPILISNFYSQHVKPCLAGSAEIKQTKFKKVGVLMKNLEMQGIIVVKDQKKGVLMITEVNFAHPSLRGVKKLEKEEEEVEEEENIAIVQAFTCNAHVTRLFSLYGHKKGDILSRKTLRDNVITYIKSHDLADPDNKKLVRLDPLLSTIIKTRDLTAQWNQVIQKVESNCGKCYVISLPDKFPITVKGDLPPIQFKVEKRTGNKKVTIISNFEVFGIEAKELAQKLQHVMSSSAAVVPGLRTESNVLVQGDARRLASKLLIDEYKIPKTFVDSS